MKMYLFQNPDPHDCVKYVLIGCHCAALHSIFAFLCGQTNCFSLETYVRTQCFLYRVSDVISVMSQTVLRFAEILTSTLKCLFLLAKATFIWLQRQ